jgi:hypothetical protein
MSFILDALKKLERQKQQENASGDGETVMEGGRRWGEGKRPIEVGKSVVIIAFLALAIAGFALYRSLSVEKPVPPAATVSRTPPPEPSAKVPTPTTRPVAPMEEPERDVDDPAASTETQPVEETELPTEEEPASPEPVPEDVVETVPPVRLVGRTDVEEPPDESENPAELTRSESDGDAAAEVPESLPELVLQGTSVVDGRPVAVINYQRLYEGDTIEGARVLKISDRVVELEYEGRRFTIKL